MSPAPYRPDPRINQVQDFLADPVEAASFPQTILRFRNDQWDSAVGLGDLSHDAWIRHFGRFEPLPDNLPRPLALRYHGHQFRSYNPELGDGRGFLFAQLRDERNRLLDLGTKGSGQTPYSRFGDGRLTLKGGVREVLATEMLEALAVDTSKTFSLIETGEELVRGDEPSPTRSAVLVRLSHSHIRIGSFERLAALEQPDAMRRLVRYCLTNLLDEPGEDGARLFEVVTRRCARLAASYGASGFVHGVLNSDNINVTGESFDYGPWRWTALWDPAFTAAYFDQTGLYSFGRQAEAVHWNLLQLARALTLIAAPETLQPTLEAFGPAYERAFVVAVLARLGLRLRDEEADRLLARSLVQALGEQKVTIDRAFFDWRGGALRAASTRYDGEGWAAFRARVAAYAVEQPVHAYWADGEPCTMYIDEVEAIWARIAEADDWSLFAAKVAAIRRMGEAMRHGAKP